jgi:hypothetical protein
VKIRERFGADFHDNNSVHIYSLEIKKIPLHRRGIKLKKNKYYLLGKMRRYGGTERVFLLQNIARV